MNEPSYELADSTFWPNSDETNYGGEHEVLGEKCAEIHSNRPRKFVSYAVIPGSSPSDRTVGWQFDRLHLDEQYRRWIPLQRNMEQCCLEVPQSIDVIAKLAPA